MSARGSAAGRRVTAVLVAVGVLLTAETVRLALATPNAHADNLYNLGMVRHSAAAPWWPLLETSYLHWFFEAYPVTRPEDWHRGASLVMVAGIARLVGGGRELLLRLPHLGWVLGLWWVAWRLASAVAPGGRSGSRRTALAVLVLAFLVLLPPGPQVISGAFMDDVPAACCTGLVLLLLIDPRTVAARRAAAIGALAGLAFLMKDMALQWGLLAPLLVAGSTLLSPGRRLRPHVLAPAAVCLAAFLAVAGVKIGWNLVDLGEPLPQPARLGMVARNVPGVVDGEHHLWFLDRSAAVDDGRLTRALDSRLAARVGLGARLTSFALADLAASWLLCGVGLLVLRRTESRPAAVRLAGLTGVVAAATVGLGILHLIEPLQLRYWLPVTIPAAALGAAAATALTSVRLTTAVRVAAVAGLATAVAPAAAVHGRTVTKLDHLQPYSPDAVAAARRAGRSGPVMVEAVRGTRLWATSPDLELVGVRAAPIAALDGRQLRLFLKAYPVAAAVVDLEADPILARVLVQRGFVARERFGSELVLEPPRRVGPDPIDRSTTGPGTAPADPRQGAP